MEPTRIETDEASSLSDANGSLNVAKEATRDDAKRPEVSASPAPAADAVEAALAEAIRGATSAGRWDVVAQLAKELEARRLARAGNVVALGEAGTLAGHPRPVQRGLRSAW
ncbi:MAG: hypothetical protein ACLQVI_09650 [Polyangiaceae bacterium]